MIGIWEEIEKGEREKETNRDRDQDKKREKEENAAGAIEAGVVFRKISTSALIPLGVCFRN